MDTESGLMVARWFGGLGEEVRGLRSTNRQLQKSRGAAEHSTAQKIGSQRSSMKEPWP